jgi:toxin YoeB
VLLVWDENAWQDYLWWQAQDRKVLKRINVLFADVVRNGNEGIGKPEPLKHDFAGYWSRRITDEHRLVYKVAGEEVRVAACRYHYGYGTTARIGTRFGPHSSGDYIEPFRGSSGWTRGLDGPVVGGVGFTTSLAWRRLRPVRPEMRMVGRVQFALVQDLAEHAFKSLAHPGAVRPHRRRHLVPDPEPRSR